MIQNGAYDSAISNLKESLRIAHQLDLNEVIENNYNKLSECYFLTQDFEKAYVYRDRAAKMDDHISSMARLTAIDNLEIQYQTTRKEKELAIAKNESLRQAQKAEQNQSIIALLLLGLVTVISAYHSYQQKQRLSNFETLQKQWQLEYQLDRVKKEKQLAALKSFFTGQEKERRRIASDLHDSLGGLLYALNFQLTQAKDFPFFQKTNELLKEAIQENRRISENLVPPTLDRMGLVPAVKEWIASFEERFSIMVDIEIFDMNQQLSSEIRLHVFRIIQELMNNVGKHAQADEAILTLKKENNYLIIMVEDNGVGFDLNKVPYTFLKTVESRVEILNGTMNVESKINRGSTVMVKISLSMPPNYPLVSI